MQERLLNLSVEIDVIVTNGLKQFNFYHFEEIYYVKVFKLDHFLQLNYFNICLVQ